MKKILAAVGALIVLVGIILAVPAKSTSADFLRIHIRADSNDSTDQNVKYVVKSAVVYYLTPKLTNATSKSKRLCVQEQSKALSGTIPRPQLQRSNPCRGRVRRADCGTGERARQ